MSDHYAGLASISLFNSIHYVHSGKLQQEDNEGQREGQREGQDGEGREGWREGTEDDASGESVEGAFIFFHSHPDYSSPVLLLHQECMFD